MQTNDLLSSINVNVSYFWLNYYYWNKEINGFVVVLWISPFYFSYDHFFTTISETDLGLLIIYFVVLF